MSQIQIKTRPATGGGTEGKMRLAIAIGLAIELCATQILAADTDSKKQPEVANACRVVPGELNVTADEGAVLWLGGSTKSYVVGDVPDDISKIFDRDLTVYIYGDFEICPLPGRSRFNQENANIRSASHLAVVPSRDEPDMTLK
jgi:hypothetical protein